MWWRALRVSGRADITEHGACCYPIADRETWCVRVEMCVVVDSATRSDDRNCLTAKIVFADVVDEAAGCGEHGRALRGEDVLTFMQTISAPRRVPRVGNLFLRDVCQWHGELAIGFLHRQPPYARVKDHLVADR